VTGGCCHLPSLLVSTDRELLSPGRSSLTVHRLPDHKEYDLDEEEGLLCEARSREGPFDVPLAELDGAGSGNRKLVGDYGYWFGNYR
jgi:hypothetical protein